MKNFYFDICAIPIFLMIIHTYFTRKMTKFRSFRMFMLMDITSLLCAILDILMEFVVNPLPLSQTEVVLGTIISFSYKLLRNSGLAIYLLFIFAITKTDHKIVSLKNRLLLWGPNILVVILLLQNFFTGNVFSVTASQGYQRGPLLIVLYVVALIYMIEGIVYCGVCRKYLETNKWLALISVYILTAIAVLVQFLRPQLMVEMFSTAIGMLMVMLIVMRPEESVDSSIGIQTFKTFRNDLRNIILSKEKATLAIIHIPQAENNRNYLGDENYTAFISEITGNMEKYLGTLNHDYEIYFEHPDNIYLIFGSQSKGIEETLDSCLRMTRIYLKQNDQKEIWFDPQICLIRYPEDINDETEIINLCHRFTVFGGRNQKVFRASEIVKSRDFTIQNNIDEILERAINDEELKMFYQPIFSVKENIYHSAEALARIIDKEYGIISPNVFIPAAERSGAIIPLGERIIDKVFRFVSEHELQKLNIAYLEINLSVAQLLQYDLPDVIARLQKKYNIDPSMVNFEITESLLDSMSYVMDANIKKLSDMGYSFSLDDYGVGYSNIQRLRKLPLSIIKIDKSMVDDIFTEDGGVIIKNTVRMMQGINKKLIMEGAETKETVEMLSSLSCEYIQGFYFSKPLPEEDFINFLKQNNDQDKPKLYS